MPTFKSFAEFGAAVERMEKDLDAKTKVIAHQMAEKAQTIGTDEASKDLGGDLKFPHWAPKWETRVKAIPTGAILLPTRSGAGLITVANQGRHHGNAAGFSGPGIGKSGATKKLKSGGVGKVRAFKAKRWNGATRGMGTADRAVRRMEREVQPTAERGVRAVMVRHFDVD